MLQCKNCGEFSEEGSSFCEHCGGNRNCVAYIVCTTEGRFKYILLSTVLLSTKSE